MATSDEGGADRGEPGSSLQALKPCRNIMTEGDTRHISAAFNNVSILRELCTKKYRTAVVLSSSLQEQVEKWSEEGFFGGRSCDVITRLREESLQTRAILEKAVRSLGTVSERIYYETH